MVDTKQEREEFQSLAWNSDKVPPSVCRRIDRLCQMVDELQARAEFAERERDKLRAALDHAESHIQEMENAEGRAFFVDTAAMAKQLGDTMQERDTLAERVKALEGAIDYLFSQESLSDSDVREVKRLLKGNDHA